MSFVRDRLPDPTSYFEGQGLVLTGRGKWRTTRCDFHDGSDSMRVNTESGAWVCMACGEKGGDVLAYHIASLGLDFVGACKQLGAWEADGKPFRAKATSFSARSALEVLRFDALLVAVAACGAANGKPTTEEDRRRLLQAASAIEFIASEVAS